MKAVQKESREIENMKGFVSGAPVAFSLLMGSNGKHTEATATADWA